MRIKNIYQTVKDRNNPDDVELSGPFLCNRNPWLGEGYYFWDTFIDLAHWWGWQGYQGSYMICQASCEDNRDKIFDLLGDTEHVLEMKAYKEVLEKKNPGQKITVSFIIQHMRKHSNFDYYAIRASGVDTVNKDIKDLKLMNNRIKFKSGNEAYLDLTPPIQICIIDKKGIGLKNYKVIYPDGYNQDFVI